MKVSFIESEKFRAEIFRLAGILIGTPFCSLFLAIFINNHELDSVIFKKLAFGLILLLLGVLLISKSYIIMYEADIKYYKRI